MKVMKRSGMYNWFNNRRLSSKLLAGFLFVSLITALVGGYSLVMSNHISNLYVDLYNCSQASVYLGKIGSSLDKSTVAMQGLILNNGENLEGYQGDIKSQHNVIDQYWRQYEEVSTDDASLVNELETKIAGYYGVVAKIIEHYQQGNTDPAELGTLMASLASEGEQLRGQLEQIETERDTMIAFMLKETNESKANGALFVIGVIVSGVLIAIFMGVLVARKIIKPVEQVLEVAEKVAEGNFDVEFDYDYEDELGDLTRAIQTMVTTWKHYIQEISQSLRSLGQGNLDINIVNDYKGEFAPIKVGLEDITESLNTIVLNIKRASEEVASGAMELSSGATNLSMGATEQAEAIEQLSAAVNDIHLKTQQYAEQAKDTNQITVLMNQEALAGNKEMKQMLGAMEEINQASASIYKIIKVIDDIAFQTNILALNAAVEAARAGNAGKGFAVVADEVRNLAFRSAEAAKETTQLIQNSIEKISVGANSANEVAELLEQLIKEINQVTESVDGITTGFEEQSRAIEEVNSGVQQVSSVVHTNSATAEQSAAASEELAGQAELLQEMVARFRVNDVEQDLWRG